MIVDDRLFKTFQLSNGPVTPIIINNNLIDFTTTPAKVGKAASIVMRPKVAPWTVTSQVKTVAAGGETKIKVTSPSFGKVVLTGTITADNGPNVNTYAFEDPARYARTAFIEALRRAGVKVDADATAPNPEASLPSRKTVAGLPTVARLKSLSLQQEATYVLKVSYNRGAQTMVCLLAVAAGSRKCEEGLPEEAKIWRKAGLNTDTAVFIDGSGLPGNLILHAGPLGLHRRYPVIRKGAEIRPISPKRGSNSGDQLRSHDVHVIGGANGVGHPAHPSPKCIHCRGSGLLAGCPLNQRIRAAHQFLRA